MRFVSLILVTIISFFATVVLAAPVVWTVNGTLSSGKVITGSFSYDADTNTYSAINISSTGGVGPFTTLNLGFNTIAYFSASPVQTGQVGIEIRSTTKTNAGGTLSITRGSLFSCLNPSCSAKSTRIGETFSSGTLVGAAPAPVPTLSQWVMVLLGLTLAGGGLVMIQRRQDAI